MGEGDKEGGRDGGEGTGEKGKGRRDSGTVGQANNQTLLIKKGPLDTHSGRQKYGTHAINMKQRYITFYSHHFVYWMRRENEVKTVSEVF